VLIENFRPGTLERWGLGPDVLLADNPKLVIARISGEGQTGPRSSRPGFAATAEALSGLRTSTASRRPAAAPRPVDGGHGGGDVRLQRDPDRAVLARQPRRTAAAGRDVALTESCMALLESAIPDYDRFGVIRQPAGTGLANNVPSNLFKSSDDRWVVIAANTDVLFRRLADAMQRPELAETPRFATHDRAQLQPERVRGGDLALDRRAVRRGDRADPGTGGHPDRAGQLRRRGRARRAAARSATCCSPVSTRRSART
jgi:formyl-CoA transferase